MVDVDVDVTWCQLNDCIATDYDCVLFHTLGDEKAPALRKLATSCGEDGMSCVFLNIISVRNRKTAHGESQIYKCEDKLDVSAKKSIRNISSGISEASVGAAREAWEKKLFFFFKQEVSPHRTTLPDVCVIPQSC
jgi:hypothetical protein